MSRPAKRIVEKILDSLGDHCGLVPKEMSGYWEKFIEEEVENYWSCGMGYVRRIKDLIEQNENQYEVLKAHGLTEESSDRLAATRGTAEEWLERNPPDESTIHAMEAIGEAVNRPGGYTKAFVEEYQDTGAPLSDMVHRKRRRKK